MADTSSPQEAVAGLEAIPTPGATAARMLELARDPAATTDQFVEVIETDPGLAAELMRDANDPNREHVSGLDLRAAAEALSHDDLKRLAYCAITPERAHDSGSDEDRSGMIALRHHSVAVATAAREFARLNDYAFPEEAYGAGLLSAIGSLALATLMPGPASALRRQVSAEDDASRHDQELEAFGFDQDQISAALAEAWDFSIEMRDVLYFLNRSVDAIQRECPVGTQELVGFVRAGTHIALRAGLRACEVEQDREPTADVRQLLDNADRDALVAQAREAVEHVARLATPRNSDPEARMQSLRIANNELARLLVRSEHKRQSADAVTRVMQYGLQRLGDGDPLPGLMYLTMESMGYKRMTFVEVEPSTGHLTAKISCALRGCNKVAEGSWTAFPEQHSGFPAPMIVTRDDGRAESSSMLDLLGLNACVLAPIAGPDGQASGFLTADRGVNGSVPIAGDEFCLGVIADQAALLLSFERLSREQARLATVDPLTGAATRRRLMDRLDTLISLSGRTRIPLSLAMMDLDHFKQFNDTLGHQVGDSLLQDLVKVLSKGVRKTDLVARYGGEEFVVVFPNADLDGAWSAADTLRRKVFEFGQEHAEQYGNLAISISMGVAQLRTDDTGSVSEDGMALIGRADAVLYQAKHNGRNRVERAA